MQTDHLVQGLAHHQCSIRDSYNSDRRDSFPQWLRLPQAKSEKFQTFYILADMLIHWYDGGINVVYSFNGIVHRSKEENPQKQAAV